MGLDAFVRCRCWEDGLLRKQPPRPERVKFDEHEGTFELDLPYDGHEEDFRQFDEWRRTCCTHEDMCYVSRRISNWAGYRQFQDKMREFGIDAFPTLRDELPEVNGGQMLAAQAATALAELDDFLAHDFGTKLVLVDVDTGSVIWEYIDSHHGEVAFNAGWTAGFDEAGFYVRHRTKKPARFSLRRVLLRVVGPKSDEAFRSMRFGQERVGEHEFRLTDAASGASVLSRIGVAVYGDEVDAEGRLVAAYPPNLAVERRRSVPEDFAYIVGNLRAVFEASVTTGNPVQWT